MIDLNYPDKSFLQYGPVSEETFGDYLAFGSIGDWTLIAANTTYMSSLLLTIHLQENRSNVEKLAKDYEVYEAFFNSLVSQLERQHSVTWRLLLRPYVDPIITSESSSREALLNALKLSVTRGLVLRIANHALLSIEDSIESIMKHYENDNKNGNPFYYWPAMHRIGIEEKCDTFLRNYGWDDVTLAVTSLEMKLKVIA